MQPTVEHIRAASAAEINEDQYRRPTCSCREVSRSRDQDLGPGTVQLLHLLNEMGL